MDSKLYYQDSYIRSFTTRKRYQEQDITGQWYIVLEETAFYPTGGGQPYDTGRLNDVVVRNVEEIDGEIRHYLDSPVSDSTEVIEGEINWERRFDHMQQHAGQHILSAAFEELFEYRTISFHLGQDILTIDLDLEEITETDIMAVEKRANEIILENRPIETKWVSAVEVLHYPLRKKPTVSENIRLVIIPEFDYNGCGGTHPYSTGQVGAIKILDWERQSKKIRVQFVCGNRVLQKLNEKQKVILELTKLLNASEQGMAESVNRILQNAKSAEKQLEDAFRSLLQYEAKEMIRTVQQINKQSVVSKVLQNRSMKELQKLARAIISDSEDVIVFLVSENDLQLQIVAARGAKLNVSMKKVLSDLLPAINGKGGGNDAFAQGGGEAVITGEHLLERGLRVIAES